MEDDPTTTRHVVLGTLSGMGLGLVGFFIASLGTGGMGLAMFLLNPVLGGFVVGWILPDRKTIGISAICSLLGSLAFLMAVGKEGPLCALMALPFLLVGILAGAGMGAGLRIATRPQRGPNVTTGLLVLAVPVLIFGGKQAERPLLEKTRVEIVSTSAHVAVPPADVWLNIQSIDSVSGSKPWLMHVGLPVPQRCTLEKTGVGARRTCYFDRGFIEETVTAWDPAHHMGLRIDRTHMPGRHWLGFESADYWLEPEAGGTRLTRITTISSHLYPAWYWRPLERWGIESEHRYILNDTVARSLPAPR